VWNTKSYASNLSSVKTKTKQKANEYAGRHEKEMKHPDRMKKEEINKRNMKNTNQLKSVVITWA
jgi:hypothetical protein